MTIERYPWHEPQWRQLESMRADARLPHALLLHGRHGVGKSAFARAAAMALVCERRDSVVNACGSCRGCRLFRAGTHPDFALVAPEAGKKQIGVEAVRALLAQLSLTRQYAVYKVAVLMPAEMMTRSAANSLLKTLEEPTDATVFVLVAHQANRLPATIRSRCHSLRFLVPPRALALAWLEERLAGEEKLSLLLDLASGAPIGALELHRDAGLKGRDTVYEQLLGLLAGDADPLSVAADWQRRGLDQVSHWLVFLACDLVRVKTGPARPRLANSDLSQPMQRMAEKLDLKKIFQFADSCIEARRLSRTGQSFNQQLLLESLAIGWAQNTRSTKPNRRSD